MLCHEEGLQLLALARASIASALGQAQISPDLPDALFAHGASFVTLHEHGQLRGCIGSLQAWRPLADDVRANALASAFQDPRFAPLSVAEWPAIRIEVSVLSPAQALIVDSEDDLIAQLRPGQDGLVVEFGGHRATFLPQVWEQLPAPRDFLAHLKHKAGLSQDAWSPAMRWSRYEVQKWQES